MPVSPSIEGQREMSVGCDDWRFISLKECLRVGLIYESFIRKDQQPLPHGARGLLGGLRGRESAVERL